MTDVQSRLVDCFAAVFPDLPAEEIPTATMDGVEAWDSLGTVTLLSVVQEEFGVQVDPEDVARFTSFDAIRAYLADRAGVAG